MMPTTKIPTQTRRKWRVAATSIMFVTHLLQSLTRKQRSSYITRNRWRQAFHAVRASSRVSPAAATIVDIPLPEITTTSSFDLRRATLAASLVREKNLDGLRTFGGVDGVLAALGTDSDHGISGGDGDNLCVRTRAFGICSKQEEWEEGGYMLLIALVYSVLCSVLDFGVEKYLDRSVGFTNNSLFGCSGASVIRSSSEQLIPVSQIVVGDVVVLKPGEDVPADGLLIDDNPLTAIEFNPLSNNGIEVNNSVNPFLFSGSRVITGTAKMVVTAVGPNTRLWEKQAVATVNHKTELQARVQKLMSVLKKVSFGVALVVLVVMLGRYFSGYSRDEQGNPEFNGGETGIRKKIFMISRIILVIITIGLAMDSESYSWVVKICQGYMIKKMAADGILVRKLSALEKLGSVMLVVVTGRTVELTETQMNEFQETGVSVIVVDKYEEIKSESSIDSAILREVRSLKQRGNVVAILTSETDKNVDSLALEEADVRVLVSSGSDENQSHKIAKLAKSYDVFIINLNDHFASSVIKLLTQGRCVIDNTRKLIHFQLTAGVVSLLDSFIYAVSENRTPTLDNKLVYSLLQLVWVNLILGLLAAIALSREQPQFKTQQVNNKKRRLIYGCMCRNIVAQVVYQTTLMQVMRYKGESIFGLRKRQNDTMSYVIFFSCQVLNMFNARKVEEKNVFEGILKNRVFMVIIVAIVVMQIVFVDFLHKFLNLEKLDWEQKFKCVGLPFASLVVGVVVKLVPVPT